MVISNKNISLCIAVISVLIASVTISAPQIASSLVNPNSQSTGFQAKIPADPPTRAASITVPGNGQSVTALPIKVGGLCTTDLLVKLFKNGVFAGSTQCINGAYSINIDLFNGKNDLVARVYDALDQTGPDSGVVSVNFTEGGFNTSAPRIIITSDYAKRGVDPGDSLKWPLVLSGGTAPYAASVDWGDGNTELISRPTPGAFDITHKYSSPGVYTIIVKITDTDGQSAFLQLVGVANGALTQDNQKTSGTVVTRTKIVWWPLAVGGVLVFVSFWLGGKFMLVNLRKQAEKRIQY
jgi:hypothetical protein